ncbi:MAG: hypothetical protein RLY16_2972 [Bacteroidota bacterium]|jgi:glycosyltransferase involved in cell wall biosynthesis
MNILFVAPFKISGITGGVGRVTATLAKSFLAANHQVYYYATATAAESMMDGVPQFYAADASQPDSAKNVVALQSLLEQFKIDIVINQAGFTLPIIRLLVAAKSEGQKIITVHHNCIQCLYENYKSIITNNFKKKWWFNMVNHPFFWKFISSKFKKRFAKEIEEVIIGSDRLMLLAPGYVSEIEFFLGKHDYSHKLGWFFNPAPFEANKLALDIKENRVVYVGGLKSTQKRIERVTEIWIQLSALHPNWQLDIVGDGPARMQMERRFKETNTKNYFFHGFADPRPYLEKAKYFIMTSDFEGFPMVLVEAQAYGVVPFLFDCISLVGTVLVDQKNCRVIPSFDLTIYIDSLGEMMKQDDLRTAMLNDVQESVALYEKELIASQWLALCSDLKSPKV